MAEYSPPTPAPVMERQARNQTKFIENAYTASVIMNSFLRPILSARRPK